jgi:transposase
MHIYDASKQYKYKYSECVLLQEAYRDEKGTPRHRTVLNLSKLPKDLAQVIIAQVKGKTMISLKDITNTDNRSLGEVTVLKRLSDRLGITKILQQHLGNRVAALVLAMIINRISLPKSRYSLREWLGTTYLPEILRVPLAEFHHNRLYSALKCLKKQQAKIEDDLWEVTKRRMERRMEKVRGRMRERIRGEEVRDEVREGEEFTLMLYDMTSTYLEGLQNELAAYGYSRDKKRGKKQLVVGLVTTVDGTPVTVEALPGNTQDKSTLISKVGELRQRFGIKEVVYVFDRGMRDDKRLETLRVGNIRYITALTKSEIKKLIEENKDQNIQLGLFDERGLAEYEIRDPKDRGGLIRRYIICKSDQKRRNQRTREILLHKTEEKLEMIKKNVEAGRRKNPIKISAWAEVWLRKWKMKKYFEVEIREGFFDYRKREDVIEQIEPLDGVYVLETNTQPGSLSAEEVRSGYKNLSKVERNFRTIKSVLEIRPVNHRRADTTKGHVFLCFLALYLQHTLESLLQPLLRKRKDITFSYLLTQLREIRQSTLEVEGHRTTIVDRLNPMQKKILRILRMRILPIPIQQLNPN